MIDKLTISENITIKEALKQMGSAGEKILFVVDEKVCLIGAITDGDIRRWILNGGSISEKVMHVVNKNPKKVNTNYSLSNVKKLMLEEKIEAIPVTQTNGNLVDVLLWNKVFSDSIKPKNQLLSIPVLIMAGGRGTRMDPFTRILPKPLIPLGEKPIIEIILDNFASYGCNTFYLTVNYKGKMIQAYFDNAECKHDISYIIEDKPCGTAGGIRLASEAINAADLFVYNSDIIVKADYHDIFNFHRDKDNDITIVGSMKHFAVPYGVLELENGGTLNNIEEKPEYDFLVNTGMYVIKKSVVRHIPADTKFDFTDLISMVKEAGGKIGVYPIGQHSWIDVGQWQEYSNALKEFEK